MTARGPRALLCHKDFCPLLGCVLVSIRIFAHLQTHNHPAPRDLVQKAFDESAELAGLFSVRENDVVDILPVAAGPTSAVHRLKMK